MSGVELLPCAHCGGEAVLTGHGAPEFWVYCPAVGCKAGTEAFGSQERAAAAWNRRTPAQGLDAATIERCAQRLLIAHDAAALAPDNLALEATELRAFGDLREALALNTASATTRGEKNDGTA